jgi:uncharacterized RDD family membrane protein YckC
MAGATNVPPKRLSDRDLITPEGVNLGVRLADVSARFGALVIDLLVMVVILIVATIIIGTGGGSVGGEVTFIIWILMFFILRNFYFMLFEMGPRAATPGKRMMKIRVASRSGARLSTSSIFARNAMREIELFLPVLILLSGGTLTGQTEAVDGWMWLAATIWFLIFAFFPLFNKDRLRVGDLIGGTWVVRAPKPELLPDLSANADARSGQYAFTPQQLAAYGIAELHVLEDVLRVRDPQVMRDVAERIAEKIGWTVTQGQTSEGFLKAYYAGLRGRLEAGLLMGRRRADKHDLENAG